MMTLLFLVGAAVAQQGADPTTLRIATPNPQEDWKDLNRVQFVSFSADEKTLVTASENMVCRWNATTGERLSRFRPFNILSMDVSPDGSLAAIGDDGREAFGIFDLKTGKQIRTIVQNDQSRWLKFSPDGGTLAEGG